MENLAVFAPPQIDIVNNAAVMSEELVSNAYKMSANQWLRRKYDIQTLAGLSTDEIVHGPFAQLIRYEGQRKDSSLGSGIYDFYKICLQDHAILSAMNQWPDIRLLPFTLYIVVHELVHIVRFSMFLQNFAASEDEMMTEEKRVHEKTHDILRSVQVSHLHPVLNFFNLWREPFDGMRDS